MTTNRLSHALHALALLILCALAMIATPANAATCTGSPVSPMLLNLPTSITPSASTTGFPKLLSAWVTGGDTWYNCEDTVAAGSVVNGVSQAGDQFAVVVKIAGGWVNSGQKIVGQHSASYTIWNTSIPGLGVAVGALVTPTISGGCGSSTWQDILPATMTFPNGWRGRACTWGVGWPGGGAGTAGAQFEVAFVQTGPITSGTLAGGTTLFQGSYAVTSATAQTGPWIFGSPINFTLPALTIVGSTCNVTTGGVPPVTLPTVSTSAFGGDGTTAGETAFTLNVTCPASVTGNVYVSMADTRSGGTIPDRLNIATDGAGRASGIKLQILNNHQPITFGTETGTVTGQANQWLAGKGPDINANGGIPLTARYIRDTASGALKAGTVKGSATFTMAYQ